MATSKIMNLIQCNINFIATPFGTLLSLDDKKIRWLRLARKSIQNLIKVENEKLRLKIDSAQQFAINFQHPGIICFILLCLSNYRKLIKKEWILFPKRLTGQIRCFDLFSSSTIYRYLTSEKSEKMHHNRKFSWLCFKRFEACTFVHVTVHTLKRQ